MAIASAEACFEWTREYVHSRKAFGTTIGKMPTTRFKMAELKTDITVGRVFVDHCLDLHNQKQLDSSTASMAKYWASDLQNKFVYFPCPILIWGEKKRCMIVSFLFFFFIFFQFIFSRCL